MEVSNYNNELMPMPKSPPGNRNLLSYRNMKHLANLQLMENEITSLQDELKSLDSVKPSSRCCKELNEFVASKPDPLVDIDPNTKTSCCCFWRRITRIKCRCFPYNSGSVESSSCCCASGNANSCCGSCKGCCSLPRNCGGGSFCCSSSSPSCGGSSSCCGLNSSSMKCTSCCNKPCSGGCGCCNSISGCCGCNLW